MNVKNLTRFIYHQNGRLKHEERKISMRVHLKGSDRPDRKRGFERGEAPSRVKGRALAVGDLAPQRHLQASFGKLRFLKQPSNQLRKAKLQYESAAQMKASRKRLSGSSAS